MNGEKLYRAIKESVEATVAARIDHLGEGHRTPRELLQLVMEVNDHIARAAAQTAIAFIDAPEEDKPKTVEDVEQVIGRPIGKLVRNDGRSMPLDLTMILAIISCLRGHNTTIHLSHMVARKIEDFYGV